MLWNSGSYEPKIPRRIQLENAPMAQVMEEQKHNKNTKVEYVLSLTAARHA